MSRVIREHSIGWQPVRPELTEGVEGKLLLDGDTKVMLTRVAPGGVFRPHRDPYGHLFHLLKGQARVQVEAETYELGPGDSLEIEPGELHGYANCGEEELLLISFNLANDPRAV